MFTRGAIAIYSLSNIKNLQKMSEKNLSQSEKKKVKAIIKEAKLSFCLY